MCVYVLYGIILNDVRRQTAAIVVVAAVAAAAMAVTIRKIKYSVYRKVWLKPLI